MSSLLNNKISIDYIQTMTIEKKYIQYCMVLIILIRNILDHLLLLHTRSDCTFFLYVLS
jgi:hypothetical protein